MPAGLDNLNHIVVLMMENRSFDRMLGALIAQDKRISDRIERIRTGVPIDDATGILTLDGVVNGNGQA